MKPLMRSFRIGVVTMLLGLLAMPAMAGDLVLKRVMLSAGGDFPPEPAWNVDFWVEDADTTADEAEPIDDDFATSKPKEDTEEEKS